MMSKQLIALLMFVLAGCTSGLNNAGKTYVHITKQSEASWEIELDSGKEYDAVDIQIEKTKEGLKAHYTAFGVEGEQVLKQVVENNTRIAEKFSDIVKKIAPYMAPNPLLLLPDSGTIE